MKKSVSRRLMAIALVSTALSIIGAWSAPASAAPAATPAASSTATMPKPPAATAGTAAWQAWSAQEDTAVRATPWAEILQQQGCTATTVSFPTAAMPASVGYPVGTKVTAIDITTSCPAHARTFLNGQAPAQLTPAGQAHPAGQVAPGGGCQTITGPGSQCINPTVQPWSAEATGAGVPTRIAARACYAAIARTLRGAFG